jgi:hypothetical protein
VLDGVYHPLRAAIPSNPTRREHIIIETYIQEAMDGIITLSDATFLWTYASQVSDVASIDYNSH